MYAYLKRLGYVVVRARALPPAPPRPAKVVPKTALQLLQAPWLAARAWLLRVLASVRQFRFGSLNAALTLAVTRTLESHEGRFSSLVTGRRWATYGASGCFRIGAQWRGRASVEPGGLLTMTVLMRLCMASQVTSLSDCR